MGNKNKNKTFIKENTLDRKRALIEEARKKKENENIDKLYDAFKDVLDEHEADLKQKQAEAENNLKASEEILENAKKDATVEGDKIIQIAKEKAVEDAAKEKDAIIEAANKEKDRIIQDASDFIQKEVEQQVNEKKAALEADNSIKVSELGQKEAILNAKANALNDASNKLNADTLRLSKEQIDYKTEIDNLYRNQIDVLNENCKDLSKENIKLSNDAKKLLKEIETYKAEQKVYDKLLSEHSKLAGDLEKARLDLEANVRDSKLHDEALKKAQDERDEYRNKFLEIPDDPQKLINENADLKKKLKEAKDKNAKCPPDEELKDLREKAELLKELTNKYNEVVDKYNKSENDNVDLKRYKGEAEHLSRYIKIVEKQKMEIENELDNLRSIYDERSVDVFPSLRLIEEKEPIVFPKMSSRPSIEEFCINFRAYLQNRSTKEKLYYDATTIRTFISGFASGKMTILEGLSGTGKSKLPEAFIEFITDEGQLDVKVLSVPVQSSWKDKNDLLGFYNDFKKIYNETDFLKCFYKAVHNPGTVFIIVLDEMNLSRIEYYFADFLSVLEKEKAEWEIDLIPNYSSINKNNDAWPSGINGGKIRITDNIWFVGTANKDDSTFMISDKVYDRATVIEFNKKGKPDPSLDSCYKRPMMMNFSDFNLMLEDAKMSCDSTKVTRALNILSELDEYVIKNFSITFGNRIENHFRDFAKVFISCGGSPEEAVDVIFSTKVLRKLEEKYDNDAKTNLEKMHDHIDGKYGKSMQLSIEMILNLIKKL